MNAQALAHFPMPWLTCIALMLFFTVFVVIFVRAYLPSNAALHRRMESLPLSEEGERHE